MKGNPTAGILLLLVGALLIGLGGKYQQNLKNAWNALIFKSGTAPTATIPSVVGKDGKISSTAGDTLPSTASSSITIPSLTQGGTMNG